MTDHNSASGFKMFYLLSIYVCNYTGFNILCIYALIQQGSVVVSMLKTWKSLHSHRLWYSALTLRDTSMEERWL